MKQVISASRRTDIPAWYLDRLIGFIHQGYAEVPNPYSKKTSRVDLSPDHVHTLVLWSKNFGLFLQKKELFREYRLYFLFTINDLPDYEPSLPPLSERIGQLHELVAVYSPERVAWRFDPVIYTTNGFVSAVESYRAIGGLVAKAGVKRSIFSFLDLYGKVKRRNEHSGLNLVDPPDHIKTRFAGELAGAAESLGLSLESCSEELGSIDGIKPSACIDGRLLTLLSGEQAPVEKDPGQRTACNCTISRDIGSYRDMPCPSGCVYCYANPMIRDIPEPSAGSGVKL